MDPWWQHMRRGNFAAAWEISDAALRARAGAPCWHLPRHEQWLWDGRPLSGKRVLVRCYHGLGDTVQFIRYAPWLKAVAGVRETLVWAQPALLPLLNASASGLNVDRFLPLHDGTPDAVFDVDVEIMELPHLFRTTPETVPAAVPYLRAEPTRLPDHGAEQFRVGLVWRAGDWDERRSVPVALLAPLTEVPGIEWHVLQRGAVGLAERPADFSVLSGSDDVLAAARVMRALDLVISVDSLPAHLAGALGVPVWTLLHAEADWRWLAGREDSPWYPTMRLFEQARPGDWPPVIARVAAELARLGGARKKNWRAALRRRPDLLQPRIRWRRIQGSNGAPPARRDRGENAGFV